MIIYNYSEKTHRAYPVEVDTAPPDAITTPPEPGAYQGYVPIGNGWLYVPDYSDATLYNTENGQPIKLKWGEELPDNATFLEPQTEYDKWNGDAWVYNRDAEVEAVRNRRAARYKQESDPLKLEAEYDALVAGTEPDYTEWMAAVQQIKTEEPYPA